MSSSTDGLGPAMEALAGVHKTEYYMEVKYNFSNTGVTSTWNVLFARMALHIDRLTPQRQSALTLWYLLQLLLGHVLTTHDSVLTLAWTFA
eukprot:scaffold194_cov329-Prasinococcus_capsulatus_cf.AAC.3